jgi:Protein of unknown function (DUF2281)
MNTFIEIKELPLKAQNELLDFYEFLLSKYTHKLQRSKKRKAQKRSFIHEIMENPILSNEFNPFNRDEIYENR